MVIGILELVFGTGGKMSDAFGGVTFLIAFFILIFFLLMLIKKGITAENIILFILIFFLIIIDEGLFNIPQEYIIIPIIFIALFIGNYVYSYYNPK